MGARNEKIPPSILLGDLIFLDDDVTKMVCRSSPPNVHIVGYCVGRCTSRSILPSRSKRTKRPPPKIAAQ